MSPFSQLQAVETALKLPHPYLVDYAIRKAAGPKSSPAADPGSDAPARPLYQLVPWDGDSLTPRATKTLPEPLHNTALFFTELVRLKSSELPPQSNNSAWARARRSPSCTILWEGEEPPTLGQTWLLAYAVFTFYPDIECFRAELHGTNADLVARQLKAVLLAVAHPEPPEPQANPAPSHLAPASESAIVLRSTFWQGAGSPLGPRPIWLPEESPAALPVSKPLSSYPLTPLQHTMTLTPAGNPSIPTLHQQCWHPVRPVKPAPGAVVYSRWIPHLKENFSMIVLDYHDAEHLQLFHEWQNDPRVSQGWNETGTLDQHREYLRKIDEDPHQIALLARFEDVCFAYFEIYWAKEDRLGAYYDAGDWDRGRHSLVGDIRYRGPHRVSAWWSSLMHYLFLDDPRTTFVVGEPKETNSVVVMYDLMHGFGLDKFVDLPHKRSAFVRCSRERFFQLCPLGDNEKAVGGMRIGLVPKL